MTGTAIAPVIETARFRLRPAERRDFDAYAAMWADSRVTAHVGGGPRSREASWRRFIGLRGMWPLVGFGYWVFANQEDDSFAGCGGLAWHDRGIAALVDVPEAGWAIAPALWGRGVATEVMAAALHWSDTILQAAQVRCIITPGNAPSERVAVKLGFAVKGMSDAGGDLVSVYARRQSSATSP